MGVEAVLANAKVVLPGETITGSVCLRDGKIAEIQPGAHSHIGALDFEGDFLIAGLIDVHTDNLERHILPRKTAL